MTFVTDTAKFFHKHSWNTSPTTLEQSSILNESSLRRTMKSQGLLESTYRNSFSSVTLEELFARSLSTGSITRKDCSLLQEVTLRHSLSEDHQAIITRILYCVRRGTLKLID